MPARQITDDELIALWGRYASAAGVAQHTGMTLRQIQRRLAGLRSRGAVLTSAHPASPHRATIPENRIRATLPFTDGTFVVFSDAHYWPGPASTAHRALVALLPEVKPQLVVANGDILDGAGISRHPRIGWAKAPSLKEEMQAVQERLGEIEAAAGSAALHRTIGNHDIRFESRLSAAAPEYEGMPGTCLADHLPLWGWSWSLMLNDSIMIKHRWANGIHAVYNNTLKSGVSIFTGHCHSLKVTPFTDYRGDRYGVDTGTLSSIHADAFGYHEDNPVNWRSGFAVGTVKDGRLMPPELCQVIDADRGLVFFRGTVAEV